MSIFPKKTIPGKPVTIHWNFNTPDLFDRHIVPFVRIGVKDPEGNVTMLFENYLLTLPNASGNSIFDSKTEENSYKYLKKNIPLLILADYLKGQQKREKLIEILERIESGRHYYFTYPVPAEAPVGKYTLVSEVILDGNVQYSKTAEDDFFLVEKIELLAIERKNDGLEASLRNHSAENTPVKILEYDNNKRVLTSIRVLELPASSTTSINLNSEYCFLLYNEEREILPLVQNESPRCIRDQRLLSLKKNENGQELIYVFNKENDDGYELEGKLMEIWNMADGINTKNKIINTENREEYDEMLAAGIIKEVELNPIYSKQQAEI